MVLDQSVLSENQKQQLMELKSKKQNLLFQAFFLIPCPPHPCLRSKMEKVIGESISSIND